MERKLSLPISFLCDRNTVNIPQTQDCESLLATAVHIVYTTLLYSLYWVCRGASFCSVEQILQQQHNQDHS